MFLNLKLMILIAAGAMALIVGAYWYGRYDGSSACDARHASKTLEVVEKVRKTDAKIKREAPDDTDKQLGIEFLLQYTRQ